MLPSKFKNLNLFLDGVGYQGQIEEIEIPKLAIKTEEYVGGGMGGPVDLDMGLEKMVAMLTFGGFMEELAKRFGQAGVDGVPLRARGAYENDQTLAVDSVEIVMRGRLSELDIGTWKRQENNNFKTALPLAYFKISLNDKVLIEIDMLNLKFVVDGVDRYEEMRNALGL
ncbi:phage major tail tube protein [Maricurvus nonylphenolicus]|uniref:phage major tail tube protein n=1 Tax=Maricurvus nonylphenolicus TaxID=1008307 RepID=UPI0036F1AD04